MKVRELPQCSINKMKTPIETVYAVSPQNSSARTGYTGWILDFLLGATDTAVSVLLLQFSLRAALRWVRKGSPWPVGKFPALAFWPETCMLRDASLEVTGRFAAKPHNGNKPEKEE